MLGQIGGRKNRRSVVDLQVPDNMTAADVRKVTRLQVVEINAGGVEDALLQWDQARGNVS
jgi:hypothetical protein